MRTPRPMTFVTILAAAVLLVFATSAAAQNPFIIDGVVPANGTVLGPDQAPDPFGNARELGPVNGSPTKVGVIHAAPTPMLEFTNPNGQVDLRNIWTQSQKGGDGHVWFYFAWERDANTGSGFIAYEFQQAALSPACTYTATGIDMVLPASAAETALIAGCNPWRNRQPGDFLIMWDQQGNGLTITKRVFVQSGSQLVLGPNQVLGSAVAAISADGFRGEASIDLTTDVFPADQCVNFANILPGTVTGNSDTADYKDTVFAVFEPISNCGIVTVTKATDPAGQSGTFPYTLQRADGSPIRFDGTLSVGNTLTGDGNSTGSPILNLVEGTNYTLTEGALASPWELVSIVCAVGGGTPVDVTDGEGFTVEAGTTTACTITNRRRRGSITVIKHVVNDHGGTAVAGDFTITLGDTANTTFPGAESPGVTYTFDDGYAYNVTELPGPAGYALISASGACSGAIVADTTQVCTLTNDDIAPQLIVIKHVVNDNGGTATAAQWTMNVAATNPSAASFPGAEAPGVTITLSAGAFTVTESGGASGYQQTSAVGCVGTIALGETRTCVVTNNDQPAQLIVIKHVINDNGGTATAAQWTMNVAASNPSQASFPAAEAPGTTITLDAGAFGVTESGGPTGYTQTSAVGCTGTIAVGQTLTCTITNDDEKAAPAGETAQRVVLHDTLTITGVRTGSPGAPATVTFRLYSDASCTILVGMEGPVPIAMAGTTGTATTVAGVGPITTAGVYHWIAEYTGDQFNTGFVSACGEEQTTVAFQQ